MDVKLLVVMHKCYPLPEDKLYLPVLVGAAKDQLEQEMSFPNGFARDDSGDNIAQKNPTYCELTALYWGWKNLKADYIGLSHYRRYLAGKRTGRKWNRLLTCSRLERKIAAAQRKGIKVFLPKKRCYVIETLYSHYAHSHHEEDLKAMEQVIAGDFPEYLASYREVMGRRSAHMFNMYIMERGISDKYCAWMFAVLKGIEERLDISGYTDFDKRVFGRLSELLLDVWLTKNNIPFEELPLINMDGEKWAAKIALFIKRKIRGGK